MWNIVSNHHHHHLCRTFLYVADDPTALVCENSTSDTPGTCAFGRSAIGDPCVADTDCAGSLRCDAAVHACARAPGTTSCAGGCDAGFFCNSTDFPGVCSPALPVGAPCVVGGLAVCTRFADCIPPNDDPFSITGLCTTENSLPDGYEYEASAEYFYAASELAYTLCKSGLGVPVKNDSTGYPSNVGRCVSAYNLTRAGQSCAACNYAFSSLPLEGDGSLVCAPVNRSGVPGCMLLPSSLYSINAAKAYASILAPCKGAARGPGGVPCDLESSSVASCLALQCFGAAAQTLVAAGGFGASDIDPLWLANVPESAVSAGRRKARQICAMPCAPCLPFRSPHQDEILPTGCALASFDNATSYLARNGPGTCPVPAAWIAVGWGCVNSESTSSQSPSPSPSQSPSPSPSPSVGPRRKQTSSGLSVGEIAGIVLASTCGAGLIGWSAWALISYARGGASKGASGYLLAGDKAADGAFSWK